MVMNRGFLECLFMTLIPMIGLKDQVCCREEPVLDWYGSTKESGQLEVGIQILWKL